MASLFAGHGQAYQRLSAHLTAYHDQFVRTLQSSADAYAGAEAANAAPLQSAGQGLLNLINAPTEALLGRPLVGNGADGPAGRWGSRASRAGSCTAMAETVVTAALPERRGRRRVGRADRQRRRGRHWRGRGLGWKWRQRRSDLWQWRARWRRRNRCCWWCRWCRTAAG
ncbi:PE family protein [Mycobacterium kansasii]|uniref:PE family protein n=1 Tax=Mycobacterium kansasii TaxID=1768 RepID=A0A1V3WZ93_MYCKA|nr:PE family protein [Mycobacterium kansasii]